MKNSNALSLVLCIGILVVLGCSCPQLAEIQKEIEKEQKRTGTSASPSPGTGTSPEKKAGGDDADLTLAKFNQLKNGMTYKEAVDIMGSEGDQILSSGEGKYQVESYKWNGPDFQYVMLTFMGGKMNSKSQNGLK